MRILYLFLFYSTICFSSETVLFLIRHGQTDWNIAHRAQGHTNNPLNEKGIAQAKALAEKIGSCHSDITALYSSDLDRAFLTAQITAEKLHLQVEKRPQLRERNNGSAEGLTEEEEQALYGASEELLDQLYPHSQERWHYTSIPGAETYVELLQRAKDELIEIAMKHPGEKIAIFAHGEVLGVFLADLLGEVKPVSMPNCSIVEVHYHSEETLHPFQFIPI